MASHILSILLLAFTLKLCKFYQYMRSMLGKSFPKAQFFNVKSVCLVLFYFSQHAEQSHLFTFLHWKCYAHCSSPLSTPQQIRSRLWDSSLINWDVQKSIEMVPFVQTRLSWHMKNGAFSRWRERLRCTCAHETPPLGGTVRVSRPKPVR